MDKSEGTMTRERLEKRSCRRNNNPDCGRYPRHRGTCLAKESKQRCRAHRLFQSPLDVFLLLEQTAAIQAEFALPSLFIDQPLM